MKVSSMDAEKHQQNGEVEASPAQLRDKYAMERWGKRQQLNVRLL